MVKNKIIAVALAVVMFFSSVDAVSCSAYRADEDIFEALAETFLTVITCGAAVIGLSALFLVSGIGILSCVDEEAYKRFKGQFKDFVNNVFRKETFSEKVKRKWRRFSNKRKIKKKFNNLVDKVFYSQFT